MAQQYRGSHTPATEYVHDDPCALFEREHTIPPQIASTLDAIDGELEEADVLATGCNSCISTDAPIVVYYVAQRLEHESVVNIKYFTTDDTPLGDRLLAHTIVNIAKENNCKVSWDGDTMHTVVLGTETAYEPNEE